ncbi:MAG TPA: hypothetical protein P5556_01685 [Candidatus Gastranaerophilales bacterium]|nr:hypothetical protein [Candidatus Gastranaerophilales bacterium]
MTKTKEELLEAITYLSSSQTLSYREICILQDKKIKLDIKSDSYCNQCYARAYVLKNDEWSLIYSIPYSLMLTPDSLAYHSEYKNNPSQAQDKFKEDIAKLKEYTRKILF